MRDTGNTPTAMRPIPPVYGQAQVRAGLVTAMTAATLLGVIIAVLGGSVAFIVSATLIVGMTVLWNYRLGVMLAILLLPFSNTELVPREMFGITGLNPLNVFLMGTTFSFCLAWLFRRRENEIPSFPPLWWLFVLPISLAALHGALYVDEIPSYFRTLDMIRYDAPGGYLRDELLKPMIIVAVAMLVAIVARNARRPELLLVPLFISEGIFALIVVSYVATSDVSLDMLASSRARGFLGWVGMHANEQGVVFNMAFALAAFTFLGAKRGPIRVLLAGLAVLSALAMAVTFSRAAFLAFLVTVAYFLFTRRKSRALLAALLLVITAASLLPHAIIHRATTGVADKDMGEISAGRVDNIWEPLVPTIADQPVIGHGLASILWSVPARKGEILPVSNPHSAYLALLLDFGAVGVIVFALFYRRLWRLFRELKAKYDGAVWGGFFEGGSVCLLVLASEGFTGSYFTPVFSQSYMWIAVGLAIGMAKRVESPPEPTTRPLGEVALYRAPQPDRNQNVPA